MATWIEPVYDRTYEDVTFAKAQIQIWIAQQMSNDFPYTYNLKGCLNLSDINRIEGNIKYISDRLDEYYYSPGTECKIWENSGLPTERDVRRILNNVQLIIDAYRHPAGAPNVPGGMSRYNDINDIEKILFGVKQLLDRMVRGFQISGTVNSGTRRMLPIRRVL